jgi:hypothetical protein
MRRDKPAGTEETGMTPQISGKTLLIPRIQYWRKHGWRAEVIIDEIGTLGRPSQSHSWKGQA